MEPPIQIRIAGGLYILAGLVNLFVGWWVAATVVSVVGTVCTGILTLGMCPIGWLCGIASMLIIPMALLEIVLGVVIAAAPQVLKPALKFLPIGAIPLVLVGDLVTPVASVVALVLCLVGDGPAWFAEET